MSRLGIGVLVFLGVGFVSCQASEPAGGELLIIIDETKNIQRPLEHAVGRGVSLSDGSFLISARYKGSLDPVIKAYHHCGGSEMKCCFIKISDGNVFEGKTPRKVLDMSTIDLDTFFSTAC
ncbi:hypothetical protein M3Y99_01231000 [Aphelenchoides fujianensis]|nr:hypothetical protein M3Y99_01231000 [Aphelenchoides fujianensis]